jgi:hypothetical protein
MFHMKKIAKSLMVGLALAGSVMCVQSAQAADINRAFTITLAPDAGSFGDSFNAGDSGKTFRDLFSFTVLSQSGIDAALVSIKTLTKLDLAINAFNLFKGATLVAGGVQHSSGATDLWSLTYPSVGSGIYSLEVEGKVLGAKGGAFGGNLNVAPVPEPATWLMMLAGFGILGLVGRRRKAGALPA